MKSSYIVSPNVRLRFCSDLHLEHYKDIEEFLGDRGFQTTPRKLPEVLALLGDIGNPRTKIYWDFLRMVSKNFTHVLLLTGNHEYYGSSIEETDRHILSEINGSHKTTVLNEEKRIEEIMTPNFTNITFMNNNTFMIHTEKGQYKIIGTTLWSDIPQFSRSEITSHISDYRLIENFTPEKSTRLFHKNIEFIEENLSTYAKNIILTHHSPIYEITNIYSYAFCSNCDRIREKVDTWLFGHTHRNVKEGNAMSNCRGYKGYLARGYGHKYLDL
jgi:predicted phosphohydrolase